MTSIEQTYTTSNGVKIKYRFKPHKYDFKHVIFVFSGFLNSLPGNYDFINAMNDCPADVIWINDDFEGNYAFYMCVNMDFKISDAVQEFMFHKTKELGLTHDDITVTGYSKGGGAAIYHGLLGNINNIVASVPIMFAGDYVHNNWTSVAQHMMGKFYNESNTYHINRRITQLLKKEKNFNKNIYVLTSDADATYKKEILSNLEDFRNYTNFNLLRSHSALVRQHNQVTSHHTALLLSIYYALATEAVPRFGEVNMFGKQPTPPKNLAVNL